VNSVEMVFADVVCGSPKYAIEFVGGYSVELVDDYGVVAEVDYGDFADMLRSRFDCVEIDLGERVAIVNGRVVRWHENQKISKFFKKIIKRIKENEDCVIRAFRRKVMAA